MNKISGLLEEWGEFVSHNLDFADEFGENILYKAGVMGGYVDRGQSESAILCPDMPPHLRKVDVAVKGLDKRQQQCIWAYYCLPLTDGRRWTKAEIGRKLGIKGKRAVEEHIQRGKRRLQIILL